MTQVIINDILPLTQAIATGGQTVYSTDWTADAASDVVVYSRATGVAANDVTQILATSAYSVAFIGAERIVEVTLVTPSTAGDIVTITRMTPADRMNLYSNTNFTPSMLNNDFGILTLVDQQNQLVNQYVAPRYNYSALINVPVDTILPILGSLQSWQMNEDATAIEAVQVLDVSIATGIKFIVQEPSAYVPAAQALSALSTGLLKNTTTTGVLSIAVDEVDYWAPGTLIPVDSGGTGVGSHTAFALIAGGITATDPVQSISGVGTPGQALISNGPGFLPTWETVPGAIGAPLTKADDTNVTLTLTGDTATSLLEAVDFALGWTGELSGTRGGTGVDNGVSTITVGSNFEMAGAFTFVGTLTADTAVTFPTSGTLATTAELANYLPLAGGTMSGNIDMDSNNISNIADLSLTDGTFTFSISAAGLVQNTAYVAPTDYPAFNGYILASTTAGVMSWIANTAGSMVSVVGTANQIDVDATDPQNPVVSLSATVDLPGTFDIQSTTAVDAILDEDNMVSDSPTALATQQSIKAYVDNAVAGFSSGLTALNYLLIGA